MPNMLDALERRSSGQRNQAQASARPARVRLRVTVRGPGEHRFEGEDGLSFRAYFLEEPSMTFGMALAEGMEVPIGGAPIGGACVLEYHVNDRGLFHGADLAVVMESCRSDLEVNFSVVFEGYALRSSSGVSEMRESFMEEG